MGQSWGHLPTPVILQRQPTTFFISGEQGNSALAPLGHSEPSCACACTTPSPPAWEGSVLGAEPPCTASMHSAALGSSQHQSGLRRGPSPFSIHCAFVFNGQRSLCSTLGTWVNKMYPLCSRSKCFLPRTRLGACDQRGQPSLAPPQLHCLWAQPQQLPSQSQILPDHRMNGLLNSKPQTKVRTWRSWGDPARRPLFSLWFWLWKLHLGRPSKGRPSRECQARCHLGLPDERTLLQELSAEVQGDVLTVHHTWGDSEHQNCCTDGTSAIT